jgi:predicted MPP superfamily phosphohydrolase
MSSSARPSRNQAPVDTAKPQAEPQQHLSRREFLALLGALGLSWLGGSVAGEVYRARVTRHHLELPNLRAPLKVAQLSDLHYGPFIREGSVRAWVAQTQAEGADLIVITGDIVDQELSHPLEPLVEALSGLSAPLGVWACLGNHDRVRFRRNLPALEAALAEAGIPLLVNRGVSLRDDLYLAGVDDYGTGLPSLEAALRDLPAGAASVLLCHQPDYLPEMPFGVDLTLIGHTHGGQVQLPFVGPLYTSSRFGSRYAEGWVRQPDKVYVSRGLGVSMLPVRLNCPAELAVFNLSPRL